MIYLLLLLAVLVFVIAYAVSPAAKARSQANVTFGKLESLEKTISAFRNEAKTAVASAARALIQDVRHQRHKAIRVEELKRHASGLRLQALKDAGLNDLSQLQGWDPQRLSQIRGIGPDSANRIAALVRELTQKADALPIPHPAEGNMSTAGHRLLEEIYAHDLIEGVFKDPAERLQSTQNEFLDRRRQVMANTGFFTWFPGIRNNPVIEEGVAQAQAMADDLEHTHPAAALFQELSQALEHLKALVHRGISAQTLDQDRREHPERYSRRLTELLGTSAIPAVTTISAPPHPASSNTPARSQTPQITISIMGITESNGVGQRAGVAMQPTIQDPSKFWVPPGKDTIIQGLVIKGGMIYVGHGLASIQGWGPESALIDPTISTHKGAADFRIRHLNYWPNYTNAPVDAQASYLRWLAEGKSAPDADIGYVFLYFYGLERRVLADTAQDPSAPPEVPIIEAEIQRLLSIYGNNGSFRGYAGSLLEYLMACRRIKGTLPVVPAPTNNRGLTFDMRLGLGLLAQAENPLPAEWALCWLQSDPALRRRGAALRCPKEFDSLFRAEYTKRFGTGMNLPLNKTRMKVVHRVASPSFGSAVFTAPLDVPDVTVLTAPTKRLQEVAEGCYQQLDAYSRFLGRNPDKAGTLEAILQLPPDLWPDPVRIPLGDLSRTVHSAGVAKAMTFMDLQLLLPESGELNKSRYGALCLALSALGLGVEPDSRFGGPVPDLKDPIAVFSIEESDGATMPSPNYAFASLAIHLASAVAHADGDFGQAEGSLLLTQIGQWLHLKPSECRRMEACLKRYETTPPHLNGLKKRLEVLSPDQRESLAELLVMVVHADGVVSPGEVKSLERIFKLLALDPKSLYSRLHQAAPTEPVTVRPAEVGSDAFRIPEKPAAPVPIGGLGLNMVKVEALKAESAKVSRLLETIFSEQHQEPAPEIGPTAPHEPVDADEPNLLGLDDDHAGLLLSLLSRSEWTRAELEEICGDRDLMVDGAIERINEAAFDHLDQAIIEGEDPIQVHSHLLEEVA